MDVKQKSGELVAKYWKKALIVVATIILIIMVVFISKWFSMRDVNQMVDIVNQEFRTNHQALFDNLAVIREDNKRLEQKFNIQRKEIEIFRTIQRKKIDQVFSNDNTTEIAQYFDNVVDSLEIKK
jgi:hypothetical protein